MAKWLHSHAPTDYEHLVDCYFGGGHFLLTHDRPNCGEIANDINAALTNFWRVLACDKAFLRFQRIIEATPFSQIEFNSSAWPQGSLGPAAGDEPWAEAAVAFFIRARQSRQGLMKDFATISNGRIRRGMNEQVSAWLTSVDGLLEVHRRLKQVLIVCEHAPKLIKRVDTRKVFFYLDPTYMHETRVTTKDYEYEMTWDQHVEMLNTLVGIKGRFMLSGYHSELYDAYAQQCGWRHEEILIDNKASSKDIKDIKTEVIWMNY